MVGTIILLIMLPLILHCYANYAGLAAVTLKVCKTFYAIGCCDFLRDEGQVMLHTLLTDANLAGYVQRSISHLLAVVQLRGETWLGLDKIQVGVACM